MTDEKRYRVTVEAGPDFDGSGHEWKLVSATPLMAAGQRNLAGMQQMNIAGIVCVWSWHTNVDGCPWAEAS